MGRLVHDRIINNWVRPGPLILSYFFLTLLPTQDVFFHHRKRTHIRRLKIHCQFYVPNLTTHHVLNLTQNVPNLTDYPNVPKIEESEFLLLIKLASKKHK